MALSKRHAAIVKEIAKKYGRVLDLDRSPSVLIEILRTYGHIPEITVEGGGGVSSVSTMGVGITPPESGGFGNVQLADLMKAILKVQRDVKALGRKSTGRASKRSR